MSDFEPIDDDNNNDNDNQPNSTTSSSHLEKEQVFLSAGIERESIEEGRPRSHDIVARKL